MACKSRWLARELALGLGLARESALGLESALARESALAPGVGLTREWYTHPDVLVAPWIVGLSGLYFPCRTLLAGFLLLLCRACLGGTGGG